MCEKAGPGPGAYMLPKETGYEKHDATRYRNPQFSMGKKLMSLGRFCGPGPSYDPGRYTRFGKATPPAYSISSRHRELARFCGPGPGTYTIETKKPNPAYSLYSRLGALAKSAIPAPNAYTLPSMLGPKVVNKTAGAAFSLVGQHGASLKCKSPGPAAYNDVKGNIYKYKPPVYSMRTRSDFGRCQPNPGPAAYLPNMPKSCSGGYSFGLKLGCKTPPYITADDAIPCIKHEK